MTEETTQQNTNLPTHKYGGSAKEWLASSAAGIASGVVAAGAAIRNEFNAEAKSLPGMADFTDTHGVKQDGLTTKHTRDLEKADLSFKGQPEKSAELQKKIRELKKMHVKDKINLFEKEYGIASAGLKGLTKGTYDRLMRLGGSNMGEVLFKGASIAVIVGVGTYNLLTSIATRKKAREIEDLILDKLDVVAKQPEQSPQITTKDTPTAHVSHITSHDRLEAANGQAVSARG